MKHDKFAGSTWDWDCHQRPGIGSEGTVPCEWIVMVNGSDQTDGAVPCGAWGSGTVPSSPGMGLRRQSQAAEAETAVPLQCFSKICIIPE